jgi:hypothetical protein
MINKHWNGEDNGLLEGTSHVLAYDELASIKW